MKWNGQCDECWWIDCPVTALMPGCWCQWVFVLWEDAFSDDRFSFQFTCVSLQHWAFSIMDADNGLGNKIILRFTETEKGDHVFCIQKIILIYYFTGFASAAELLWSYGQSIAQYLDHKIHWNQERISSPSIAQYLDHKIHWNEWILRSKYCATHGP